MTFTVGGSQGPPANAFATHDLQVDRDGRFYERDLGEKTPQLVEAMTAYDPGKDDPTELPRWGKTGKQKIEDGGRRNSRPVARVY